MPGFAVTARSSAAPDKVFALVMDGSTWPDWSPIDGYSAEAAAAIGDEPGAATEVRVFRTGKSVGKEQIVALTPGRRIDYVQLPGGPLVDYRASIEVLPDVRGGSNIRWQGQYRRTTIPGLTGFMQWYLRRFMQRCATGLAEYAGKPLPS